jgi:hypothetical protein
MTALLFAALANAQAPLGETSPSPAAGAGTSPLTEGSAPMPTATAVGDAVKEAGKVHFGGLDLGLTLTDSSGLYFHRESYYNVLSIQLDPSFALGRQAAGKDSWWAELVLSARLTLDFEVSSSEPAYRGNSFSRTQLYDAPETIALAQAGAGSADGLNRAPVRNSDLALQLAHGKLFTIPGVQVDVGASLRAPAPISRQSRNLGLITAPSAALALGREFGPLGVSYDARFTKYFYTRTSPAVTGEQNTFWLNGKQETVWRPDSTGVTNPDYGFIQGLNLTLSLPKGFGLTASYFLFLTKPHPNSGCSVPGVPTANVCLDGALVGTVDHAPLRAEQAFSASIDFDSGPVALSLGLATLRGLRQSDGKLAQPFVFINAYNYTTVSLSLTSSPETIARFLDKD